MKEEYIEDKADSQPLRKTEEICPNCGENLFVSDYEDGCTYLCKNCNFLDEYGSP
jgi:ribosomal protein S27AE